MRDPARPTLPVAVVSSGHIRLTSHPHAGGKPAPLRWGAASPRERGPVVGTWTRERNAIGAHSGSYSLYRALAVASGTLDPVHVPDLTDTSPARRIGPHPQWSMPERIVSMDPYGHLVSDAWGDLLQAGWDVRPTIAVTTARLRMPELDAALAEGRIRADGEIVAESGEVRVTKAAIEPVWHLPGIASRLGVDERALRRSLYEHSGGMFSELVTRTDLEVFLPPIGGTTVYLFGDLDAIGDPARPVACRVHDECNGSDVFGSDICTCRPYLVHGIEICIEAAQAGGCGVVAYNRKEGRALGEVTKFLVYNARKRQPGGDRADTYFERTECVAGVQDMRFQVLMPDVLHWLGISRIDRLVSMSHMKYDAMVEHGIEIGERVPLPDDMVPDDAGVEIDAKKAAGYYSPDPARPHGDGRGLDD